MGPAFEALALHRHANDTIYAFLEGGEGADYYRWHIQAIRAAAKACSNSAIGQRPTPLTSEDRRELLGETAIPSSRPPVSSQGTANASTTGDLQVDELNNRYCCIASTVSPE